MESKDFEKIEKLYHYTTYNTGKLIMKSRTLRSGNLNKMNDYYESRRNFVWNLSGEKNIYKNILNEYRNYSQISLTYDTRKRFDIPAMWGHYANKGKGVCLIFDKEKLIKTLKSSTFVKGKVKYNSNYNSILIGNDIRNKREIKHFFAKHKKRIFMHKTSDWKYEQEYRLILNCPHGNYFHIHDCLIGVIINSIILSEKEVAKIKQELFHYNIPIYEYIIFCGCMYLIGSKGYVVEREI